MNNETDLNALQGRIKLLAVVYIVLFATSLVIIVLQQTSFGVNGLTTLAWASTLGSAVAVRLYRRSLLNKYNAAKGGPMV